jgi:hypothetical protein
MTSPANGTSADISRKAWLLAQHIGYTSKSGFARDALGWDPSRFSRTLSGERQWTLDDLHTLADALGLPGPGDLFRTLGDLINSVGKPVSVSHVTEADTLRYPHPTGHLTDPLTLINELWGDYQPVAIPAQRVAGVTRSAPTREGEDADAA